MFLIISFGKIAYLFSVQIVFLAYFCAMKWFLLLPSFIPCMLYAQEIQANRTSDKIVVDGNLEESIWLTANFVEGFTQISPNPGVKSSQNTKVAMAYSSDAIYFAAICYDHPDSISKVFSARDDNSPNADIFAIFLDTYNDNLNGFCFGVTSKGVQLDAKITEGLYNEQLNLIWNSAVKITNQAWQVEIRIPYSAIRFPEKEVQSWGINFSRQISRKRELSSWSIVNPDLENYLLESGEVSGVSGINPPLRLALMPYVSAYISNESGSTSQSINGGLDIKYGINDAFTLDVTLIPDFGQVVFDNQVLNLTPFEIQFNENRQFFTEGTELFNKSGLFYSRRIGIQAPGAVLNNLLLTNERLSAVPSATQLYNATKLSGRTKSGLGIGVFNGVTAPQYAIAINQSTLAEREVLVSPLSNFNVFVLDQNLKNNSYVNFTNTNVTRAGSFYDANVSSLKTMLNTKDNNYYVGGSTALSNKFFSDSTSSGHNWGLSAGKQRGAIVYSASYFEESDTYDPNDLGYNQNNNRKISSASFSYRILKPFGSFIKAVSSIDLNYNRLYHPDVFTSFGFNVRTFAVTKNFNAFGIESYVTPVKGYDYFEPRTPGYYYTTPTFYGISTWLSSNYQKKVALDAGGGYYVVNADKWREYEYNIGLRFRLSNHLFLKYNWEQGFQVNYLGYAVPFGAPADTSFTGILFGSRNRINTTNTIGIDYTITNRMNITFRLRHYRSTLAYNSFFELNQDGSLSAIAFNGLDTDGQAVYNVNFNAFTIDFVYRWVFLPGSEINIVWKNSIFQSDKFVAESYIYNLTKTIQQGPMNSFSFKLIYWLDAQNIRKKKR